MNSSYAGLSDEWTIEKMRLYRYFLGYHLPVAAGVIGRQSRWNRHVYERYVYIDLNAGPGRYPEFGGLAGSPVAFAEEAARRSIAVDMWLCEANPETLARLREAMAPFECDRCIVTYLPGDHRTTYPTALNTYLDWSVRVYGLAYADPNGHDVPADIFENIKHAPGFDKLDFLFNVGATSYKRTRHLHARYLADDIRLIGKRLGFVRSKEQKWQWTLVHLTDWQHAPTLARAGFVPIESPEGQAILTDLNLSKKERQSALPFGQPTAVTPNTSGIRASALSVPRSSVELAVGASDATSDRRPSRTT